MKPPAVSFLCKGSDRIILVFSNPQSCLQGFGEDVHAICIGTGAVKAAPLLQRAPLSPIALSRAFGVKHKCGMMYQ